MKMIFQLFFILLIPFMAFSQEPEEQPIPNPVYLDFSIGVSVPVGKNYDAIDNNTQKSKAGYATTGMFLSAAAAFMGKSDFGLGLKYVYQQNSFKDTARNIGINNSNTMLGSGGWSNHYLMGGVFLVTRTEHIVIDGQITAGLIASMSEVFGYMDPHAKKIKTGTGIGFGFGINTGIGYNISPKVAVKLNVGYLEGYPVYTKEIRPQVIGSDPVTGETFWSAPIDIEIRKIVSAINAGAGLIIKL